MSKEAAFKPAADEAKNPATATPAAPAKPVATAAAVEKASTKPGTAKKALAAKPAPKAVAEKAAPAAKAAAASAAGISPDYFVDTLFRRVDASAAMAPSASPSRPDGGAFAPASPEVAPRGSTTAAVAAAPSAHDAPPTAEVVRIFANAASASALPADDVRYLGQLVAQRTGLGQQEAEKRVTDAFARLQAKAKAAKEQAKDAADKARSASAKAALWGFISLLIGAFVASLLGTLGGRHRDQF